MIKLDPIRALLIIEGLISDQAGDDEYHGKDTVARKIWKIAHAASPGTCHDAHDYWRQEALALEAQLVADKCIPAWKENSVIQ